MDDKKLWRVSKKDSIFETTHFSSKPDVFRRSFSTKTSSSSSSSKPILTRSFTTKPSSYPSSEPIFRRSFSAKPAPSKSPFLSRSGSMKCQADTSSTKCSISRSLSHKGASVTRKCRDVAKEHKSRFYIIKRCVLMLVCWHKHA
ncbi:hypothetical protein Bca4012_045354 [Brassica carinata]|uniref:Uncharacterized protein n=5 Tax=Brassica TaxID=3705 RepID=A0A0D3ECT1_BRAOL|nr:PREDICTED: uncharacterized protein LOC106317041 [Brassica oleracea var. oleracea]XP_013714097.1 small polypeptide DEVIL 18 [Brassica napus]KAF3499884.1 hypothetical protein F2Q69_00044192 [Brassica cretica]KAG2274677.1 hypothetical protein Bca52824_057232 [Brassica carinata]VDD32731.1 unnamed protein product [Brassica oleracea]CAF1770541.1 unnamed protein product [Brassica napus]CDY33045.1 BnaA10g12510D [Brassica napus]